MKDYKEMADSALKRIDEYQTKQEKRRKILKKVSAITACLCVILIATIAVFRNDIFKEDLPISDGIVQKTDNDTTIKNTTIKDTGNKNTTKAEATSEKESVSADKNTTTFNNNVTTQYAKPGTPFIQMTLENLLKDERVIWSKDTLKGIGFARKINKGSVAFTDELQNAIKKNGENQIYAVMVNFESSLPDDYLNEFKIDGKTATEVKNQADELLKKGENEESKKLYVKMNEAKEEYLRGYLTNFEETFNKNGMKIYVDDKSATIENMIFYSFATGKQLQNFACKDNEAFYFTLAVKFK